MRLTTAGAIIHSTRSGRFTREAEYQKTINYMLLPGTVSSHRVIGMLPGQHAQVVPDDYEAWHAQEDNKHYLSIEFAQPNIGDAFTDWQYEEGAKVCALWAKKYGFKPERFYFQGHEETAQGKRNGKSDPGPMFDWERFISLTWDCYEAL